MFNIQNEENIIGAMINGQNCLEEGLLYLKENYFYDLKTRRLFNTIKELKDKNVFIDCGTVGNECKEINSSYLSRIIDTVPSLTAFKEYCIILKNDAYRRATYSAGQQIIDLAKDNKTPDEISSEIDSIVLRTLERGDDIKYYNSADAVNQSAEHISKIASGYKGLYLGFPTIDHNIGWFDRKDLIVVGARPSIGKSTFAGEILLRNAIKNIPGGLISLEMPAYLWTNRYISRMAEIDYTRLIKFSDQLTITEQKRMSEVGDYISKLPFYIDDSTYEVHKIIGKIKQMKRKHKIQFAIIDHLQLIEHNTKNYQNRNNEIGYYTRQLKKTAKDIEIPIILLSQLNRGSVEKIPNMSDLRDSGCTEQDADVVILLHRDDYANKESNKPGIMDVIFDKIREGATGCTELVFMNKFTTIRDPKD